MGCFTRIKVKCEIEINNRKKSDILRIGGLALVIKGRNQIMNEQKNDLGINLLMAGQLCVNILWMILINFYCYIYKKKHKTMAGPLPVWYPRFSGKVSKYTKISHPWWGKLQSNLHNINHIILLWICNYNHIIQNVMKPTMYIYT